MGGKYLKKRELVSVIISPLGRSILKLKLRLLTDVIYITVIRANRANRAKSCSASRASSTP